MLVKEDLEGEKVGYPLPVLISRSRSTPARHRLAPLGHHPAASSSWVPATLTVEMERALGKLTWPFTDGEIEASR